MILEVGKDVAGTDKDSIVSALVIGDEKEQSKGEPGSSACVRSASPGEGCRSGLSMLKYKSRGTGGRGISMNPRRGPPTEPGGTIATNDTSGN